LFNTRPLAIEQPAYWHTKCMSLLAVQKITNPHHQLSLNSTAYWLMDEQLTGPDKEWDLIGNTHARTKQNNDKTVTPKLYDPQGSKIVGNSSESIQPFIEWPASSHLDKCRIILHNYVTWDFFDQR